MFTKGACTASSQIYCSLSALFEVEDMCRHTVEAECLQGLKGLLAHSAQCTVAHNVSKCLQRLKGLLGEVSLQ